jgi:hypothetical protein
MSSSSDPSGALAIVFCVGLWTFFKGFRVMREYKVLDDTPRIPIRSVPMGFVHIRGKAESAQIISSPVSQTPCCFYKVEIDEWRSKGDTHEWVHFCTDFNGYQFHLNDGTGTILIDAHAAEYDLPLTAERKVNSSAAPQADTAKLLQYLHYAQGHSMTDRMGQWVDKRFEKAGEKAGGTDNPQLQAKREAFRELFAGISGFQQGGKPPIATMKKLFEGSGPLGNPEKEQRRQMMLQNLKLAEAANESGVLEHLMPNTNSAARGNFRLREYVVVPGQEYLVSGSCVENPSAADSTTDRTMIAKGKNEPTFVISTKSDVQVHHDLKKRSLLMIFGGAAAALASAAFLLVHFGLLGR